MKHVIRKSEPQLCHTLRTALLAGVVFLCLAGYATRADCRGRGTNTTLETSMDDALVKLSAESENDSGYQMRKVVPAVTNITSGRPRTLPVAAGMAADSRDNSEEAQYWGAVFDLEMGEKASAFRMFNELSLSSEGPWGAAARARLASKVFEEFYRTNKALVVAATVTNAPAPSNMLEAFGTTNKTLVAAATKIPTGGTFRRPAENRDWPAGMKDQCVRFIRMEYDGPGWDDGMDATSRADRNFLDTFHELTGFMVATKSESHKISLLRKYPEGYAPPFVYMTGTSNINVSALDLKVMREYLADGGLLFASAGSPQWGPSFTNFIGQVFPGQEMQEIADDDPLFQYPYSFPHGAPPLWQHSGTRVLGIKHNDRWEVYFHPGGVHNAWKTGRSGMDPVLNEDATRIGINVIYYAFTHYLQQSNRVPAMQSNRAPAILSERALVTRPWRGTNTTLESSMDAALVRLAAESENDSGYQMRKVVPAVTNITSGRPRTLPVAAGMAADSRDNSEEAQYWGAVFDLEMGEKASAFRMFNELSLSSKGPWGEAARARLASKAFEGFDPTNATMVFAATNIIQRRVMGGSFSNRGGWPDGMEKACVRFIRMEYGGEGWDDGMDAVSRADLNFLDTFHELTGFKVATKAESHRISLLRKYPKGAAPPFVYMTGSNTINVSSNDVKVMREYLLDGGLLFASAGSPQWGQNFTNFIIQVFPGQSLLEIADDDQLFRVPYFFPNGAPPLWHLCGTRVLGIKHNDRWVVFFHPGGVHNAWKTDHSGMDPVLAAEATKFGVNVLYYAFTHYLEMTRKYRQ